MTTTNTTTTNGNGNTDGQGARRLTAAHRRAPSDLRNAARRIAEGLDLDGQREAGADLLDAVAAALDAFAEARKRDNARG